MKFLAFLFASKKATAITTAVASLGILLLSLWGWWNWIEKPRIVSNANLTERVNQLQSQIQSERVRHRNELNSIIRFQEQLQADRENLTEEIERLRTLEDGETVPALRDTLERFR